jgi:hypothetical protein
VRRTPRKRRPFHPSTLDIFGQLKHNNNMNTATNSKYEQALETARQAAADRDAAIAALRATPVRTDTMYLTAAAFAARLSTAGRIAPAAAPAGEPRITIVERWNGTRFVEVRLVWNGTQYAEVK